MPSPETHPVTLSGHVDPSVSRGLGLVKWLLVVPHAVLLFFLWVAVLTLTVVAWFAILVTGRYPRTIFDFNVGVLRWSWRVFFYSYGALATDRYPPFTLADVPDYPARLDVAYPEHLSRGLVLVKSWLLAVPHYLVLGFFLGVGVWSGDRGDRVGWPWTVGLVGLLVLVAGVVLLFGKRYPGSVFDLVLGMDRWAARVVAYALLMTDVYPPFRLDQGGDEPSAPTPGPGPAGWSAQGDPAAEPTAAGPTRHWTALRIVSVSAGSLVLALALGIGVAGGALLFADKELRDSDGFLMTDGARFTTSTYAVVADDMQINGRSAVHAVVGDLKLTVRGSDQPVVLGIAPAAEVHRYLDGVAHAVVTEIRDGTPLYRQVAGGPPATPPSGVRFWAAHTVGQGTRTVRWDVTDGDWAFVLMNADGSAPVSAQVAAGATLPVLGWGAVTLLVLAGAFLVAGLLLVLLALPRGGRSASNTSATPPTPAPPVAVG